MKRTYASGAEKRKISDNKRKALFNLPKVTSFFGPASVTLPATAAAEPPSQDARQNTDYPSSTETDGNNDDQTLLVEQEYDDQDPTAETGEGDAREKAPFTETDPGCWPEHIADDQRIDIVSGPVQIEEFNFTQSQSHRRFTKDRYFMKMKNGEKIRRSWLVYSKSSDSVFCFCCTLFGKRTSSLTNRGFRMWE